MPPTMRESCDPSLMPSTNDGPPPDASWRSTNNIDVSDAADVYRPAIAASSKACAGLERVRSMSQDA